MSDSASDPWPASGDWGGSSALLRALFWLALLVAFVVATLPHPLPVPGQPSDKLQHILAFLALASLGTLAYPRLPSIKLGVGLSLFGGLIEAAQAIPILNRSTELLDWVADTAAVTSILLARLAWRSLRRKT